MYYPHADDEIVAMGYANYYNQTEENDAMVTVNEETFRVYMTDNYFAKLEKETLLDLLEKGLDLDSMVTMASELFGLPFELSDDNKIVLSDVNELLSKHSYDDPPVDEDMPCMSCDDDDDWGIIPDDGDDWDDEEFAPYDDLDDQQQAYN